ncbi:hypothetical protein [Lacibacter sediminis]|uniref:Uncharacterized protein n=1 Tax=Lacibacter sediminis TaxID=2760713 RepID=A0A7G5XGX5_9BACT|nr:hypothetical protein [Lacibacter sediminis]QNA44728.1 hypothetical protein H4075_00595 [Lacibacter sediminis]
MTILVHLLSCGQSEKKSRPKQVDTPGSNLDKLPNGKRLLDNINSKTVLYYKEVVGTDTLKGGYITCYGIDDSMKYFYLRHGDTLHLLNETPIYTSTWSLGVLEKDFDNFFITRIDNGNGVPETYQVFDKKHAKNILGDKVVAWNFKYLEETLFFLYDNHTVNLFGNDIDRKQADSIFLYNMKSGIREGYKLPKENQIDIIYYDIKNLTNTNLIVSRTNHNSEEEKLVKYRR